MKGPQTFDEFYDVLSKRKVAFFMTFFVAVTVTYAILFAIDFIPEPIKETSSEVLNNEANKSFSEDEALSGVKIVNEPLPIKIVFDSLDKEITVLNPQSRKIAELDEALLSGAVRHPDSADFQDDGNIFILGHSSYLPNVFNKNFQAFNSIQKLTWGDKIRLQSADMEYVYRVEKVYEAKASEVFVPETPGEARLTLATCNSFGSKDDRFIVESVLIGSYKL